MMGGFSLLILQVESKEFECGCSENLDPMLSSGSPFSKGPLCWVIVPIQG